METISAIRGNSAAADGTSALFDEKEMQSMFQETGFVRSSVNVLSEYGEASRHAVPEKAEIEISGFFPENRKDAVEEAGIVRRTPQGQPSGQFDVTLLITAETLRKLYGGLPGTFRSYLDLFMAPSFSGEAMSDEEYLDLIATVYGSALADEIAAADVALSLVSPRGRQAVEVPLLRLLNFTEPIVLRG